MRIVRREACLVDRQRPTHQRLRPRQAARVLEQQGEVGEAHGDLGVIDAEDGLVDRQRAAHQATGLGLAIGGLEQPGQVVNADGDHRVFRTEMRLVDRQRAAYQGLGLSVERLLGEQAPDFGEQAGGRNDNAGLVGVGRHRPSVGRQRVEDLPLAYVRRVAHKGIVYPVQRLDEYAMSAVFMQEVAPGDLLHESVHAEVGGVGRMGTCHQGKRIELRQGDRVIDPSRIGARHGNVQQPLGNGLRRQPGQPLQQPAGGGSKLVERSLPCDGDASRVVHLLRVVPRQYRLPLALPSLPVLPKAEGERDDVGAGLLKREGEKAQFQR